MALRTKVKVGNITNLSDARYCAGMGVDMLGFKISETKGQVSPIKFKEIADWISGPEFILEISKLSTDEPLDLEGIDLVELPASEISGLDALGLKKGLIISLGVTEWRTYRKDLMKHKEAIKYLLVNSLWGINKSQAKDEVAQMSNDFSVLFGSDVTPELLEEFLSWPIEGLALKGSEETSPGVKDYDHLSSILERLEVD